MLTITMGVGFDQWAHWVVQRYLKIFYYFLESVWIIYNTINVKLI